MSNQLKLLLRVFGLTAAVVFSGTTPGLSMQQPENQTAIAGTIYREFLPSVMTAGVGYNSLAADVRGNCVTETAFTPRSLTRGHTSKFISIVSQSHMQQKLDIKASESLNTGVSSESARAKFVESLDMDSNSAYVLSHVKVTRGTASLATGNLLTAVDAKLLKDDPGKFAFKCGDYYLNAATFGAEYIGVAKITNNDFSSNSDFLGEVSGAVSKVHAGASVSAAFDKINKNYTIQITEKVIGANVPTTATTIQDIFAAAHSFPTKVKEGEAVEAVFKDYEVLSNYKTSQPLNISQQIRVIKGMLPYYDAYQAVQRDAAFTILRPMEFMSFKNTDVQKTGTLAENEIQKIENMFTTCSTLIKTPPNGQKTDCQKPTYTNLPPDLENQLPKRLPHLPKKCSDYQAFYQKKANGVYTLYYMGRIASPYKVYCNNMAAGVPKEYLELTGTPNTAQRIRLNLNMVTTFTKIRLEPSTLSINLSDFTFATSTGGSKSYTYEIYGGADACISDYNAAAMAQINLTGTPFFISPSVRWIATGWHAAANVTFGKNRQTATIRGGGNCGGVGPSPALELEYSGNLSTAPLMARSLPN